jgi:hypothetical protein
MKLTRKLTRQRPEEKTRKKCLRKFLYYFPGGFKSKKYQEWERNYKWSAHEQWQHKLNKAEFKKLLERHEFAEIAKRALAIESKTNLLFSFEKMALRDAVKSAADAKRFAEGLYSWLYRPGLLPEKFCAFRDMLASLPVKQTRVVTWPVLTVFGFIAEPAKHIYLKPTVTKTAAAKYKFNFYYSSRPEWKVYESLLSFADQVRKDTAAWQPQDMIDLQSFIWVLGSDEYPD